MKPFYHHHHHRHLLLCTAALNTSSLLHHNAAIRFMGWRQLQHVRNLLIYGGASAEGTSQYTSSFLVSQSPKSTSSSSSSSSPSSSSSSSSIIVPPTEKSPFKSTRIAKAGWTVGRVGFGGDDFGLPQRERMGALHGAITRKGCNMIVVDCDSLLQRTRGGGGGGGDKASAASHQPWERTVLQRLLGSDRIHRSNLVICGQFSATLLSSSSSSSSPPITTGMKTKPLQQKRGPSSSGDTVESILRTRVEQSLAVLGLVRFDSVIIHFPVPKKAQQQMKSNTTTSPSSTSTTTKASPSPSSEPSSVARRGLTPEDGAGLADILVGLERLVGTGHTQVYGLSVDALSSYPSPSSYQQQQGSAPPPQQQQQQIKQQQENNHDGDERMIKKPDDMDIELPWRAFDSIHRAVGRVKGIAYRTYLSHRQQHLQQQQQQQQVKLNDDVATIPTPPSNHPLIPLGNVFENLQEYLQYHHEVQQKKGLVTHSSSSTEMTGVPLPPTYDAHMAARADVGLFTTSPSPSQDDHHLSFLLYPVNVLQLGPLLPNGIYPGPTSTDTSKNSTLESSASSNNISSSIARRPEETLSQSIAKRGFSQFIRAPLDCIAYGKPFRCIGGSSSSTGDGVETKIVPSGSDKNNGENAYHHPHHHPSVLAPKLQTALNAGVGLELAWEGKVRNLVLKEEIILAQHQQQQEEQEESSPSSLPVSSSQTTTSTTEVSSSSAAASTTPTPTASLDPRSVTWSRVIATNLQVLQDSPMTWLYVKHVQLRPAVERVCTIASSTEAGAEWARSYRRVMMDVVYLMDSLTAPIQAERADQVARLLVSATFTSASPPLDLPSILLPVFLNDVCRVNGVISEAAEAHGLVSESKESVLQAAAAVGINTNENSVLIDGAYGKTKEITTTTMITTTTTTTTAHRHPYQQQQHEHPLQYLKAATLPNASLISTTSSSSSGARKKGKKGSSSSFSPSSLNLSLGTGECTSAREIAETLLPLRGKLEEAMTGR